MPLENAVIVTKAADLSRRAVMIKREKKPLHPRLMQLNQDMAIDRSKDIVEIHACRDGLRFKITVHRNPGYGFVASTKVLGRVMTRSGRLPSDAFQDLTRALSPTVRRMEAERAEAEFAAMQGA